MTIYDKISQRWRVLSPTHGHAFSKPKCGPCDAKVKTPAGYWMRSCPIDTANNLY